MPGDARATFFFATLLLGILLISQAVMGVGFGNPPSNREIIFRQGTDVRVPFFVIHGEHLQVSASTLQAADPTTLGTANDDNMLQYITIDDAAPGTGPREVAVVFRFPDHEMHPGTYPIDIVATDYSSAPGGATITAVASVKLRLTVWVLSPDPVIEVLGVSATPIAEGMDANATVAYVSRTVQDLAVVASIRVVDVNGTVLVSSTAPSRMLPSGQSATENIILPTERLPGGDYDMYATLAYAGRTAEGGPGVLKIGTLHVAIPTHTTEFTYNTTNKFRFTVENQWNRALHEVYATVRSGTQEKKTASLDIPPFGTTEYEVYFDRDEQAMPGSATVNTVVTFRDYNTVTEQYEPREEPFALPITILAPSVEERPSITLTGVLLWGLGFAVLALLIALVILLRRRKEPPVAQPLPPSAPPQQPPG